MSLQTLLNEPLPPMRLDYAQDASEGPAAPEPQGQHRLGRTSSAAQDDALSAWQYVAATRKRRRMHAFPDSSRSPRYGPARSVPQSDPSLAASLAQSVEPVSVKQVLHTTSLLKVERIIEGMRTTVRAGASGRFP